MLSQRQCRRCRCGLNDHAATQVMRLFKPCGLRDHAIVSRSCRLSRCGYTCHAALGTMRSANDHAAIHAMRPSGPCDHSMIMRLSSHAAFQAMRSFNGHVSLYGHSSRSVEYSYVYGFIFYFVVFCSDKTSQDPALNSCIIIVYEIPPALSNKSNKYQGKNKNKKQMVIHSHGVLKNTLF